MVTKLRGLIPGSFDKAMASVAADAIIKLIEGAKASNSMHTYNDLRLLMEKVPGLTTVLGNKFIGFTTWLWEQIKPAVTPPPGDGDGDDLPIDLPIDPENILDIDLPDLHLPKFPSIGLFDIFDPEKRREFFTGMFDYFWQSPDEVTHFVDALTFPLIGPIGFNPFVAKFGIAFPLSLGLIIRNKARLAIDAGLSAIDVKKMLFASAIGILLVLVLTVALIWFIIKFKPVRRLISLAMKRGNKIGGGSNPKRPEPGQEWINRVPGFSLEGLAPETRKKTIAMAKAQRGE